ncbi:DUF6781 family protein [Thiobacter aerophilum]|uniref:DUF6781 family protein n=1 Tax=Thiobacter aerophilum TaxID=3121275 RepID=A0ABV0EAX6_9BURK
MNATPISIESVREEAAASAEQAPDLRTAVRDLTLRALTSRALELSELRAVLAAVTEGVSLGLARRGGELKAAAADALAGLDEAVRKSAEATKLAAEQFIAEGKALTAEDLRPVLEDLRRLEGALLEALGRGSERAQERVKQAFADLLTHARRTGTDTGRMVAETVESLANRAAPIVKNGAAQGTAAAGEVARRLALVASGILAGVAQALQDKAGGKDR